MYKVESLENFKDKSFITFKNFYNLMKPRVMSLVIFTAFVGMILSNQQIDFFKSAISLFFVAIGAGAAGALNMWYDSEIDAVMSRTCLRPIPLGAISNK
ncbi:MAG: UbiA family prenyltransferase, partial [Candidatus Fonsibacter sp.]